MSHPFTSTTRPLHTRPRWGLLTLVAVWSLHLAACDGDLAATASGSGGSSGGGGAETGGAVEVGDPDRPSTGTLSIDEETIRGIVQDTTVALQILVRTPATEAASGSLNVTLQSVDGADVLASAVVDYDLAADSEGNLTANLDLPAGVRGQADLAPWNLRIDDGKADGIRITRSLLYVLPPYEVRLDGPRSLKQGKAASYRVQTRDAVSYLPLSDYPVGLAVKQEAEVVESLSGVSDATGVATFELTLEEPGTYQVAATTEAEATSAAVQEPLEVTAAAGKVLLTTDKPIYQPGQTIHLRTLALVPPSNTPLVGEPVVLEVEDGKGNKIMKRTLTSDAFGIAATSFKLGQILNLGTFAIRATVRDQPTEKSVEVARYSLPKFRASVSTDRAWYSPGDSVEASVDAGYFFGRAVADAEVVVEAYTLDIGETLFSRVQGRTDADGNWSFTVPLPASVAGLPLEQGQALVDLRVTVTDSAGQVVTQDKLVTLAAQPVRLSVVPEGGQLVPGVENTISIFVGDPENRPLGDAEVEITLGAEVLSTTTDAFGQAQIVWTPVDTGAVVASATVTPQGGEAVTESFNFTAQAGGEHVIVRTDRAVYQTGDTVEVELASSANSAYAYVDWLNDGQVVGMRTVEVHSGQASFSMPLDATLLGTNRVEAYVVDDDGNIVRSGRNIFVKGAGSLGIEMSTDKAIYEPGDSATLTFSVADADGQPMVAALGLQIVDEAIFSLIESRPGLLETHFQLEEAYSAPHYQIRPPSTNVGGLLLGATSDDAQTAAAQQEMTAAVLAALDAGGATGVSAGSWPQVITAAGVLLDPYFTSEQARLAAALASSAEASATTLSASGCIPSSYYCDNVTYGQALFEALGPRVVATDFWGNRYQVTAGSGSVLLVLTSRGPDERVGTVDDRAVSLSYAELSLEAPTMDWWEGELAMDGAGPGAVPQAAGSGGAASVADPDSGDSEDGPRVRKDFPETLYVNPAVITGPDGTASVEVPLADSITEWRVTALANSQSGKLGSMEDGVTVFQDFFVDIDFPATLTRGDEVLFPVAIYNYLDTEQTVELELEPADWYSALGATSATVTLAPAQVTGIRFPVRVDAVGVGTLTVRGTGSTRSDAVARTVRVLPDGRAVPVARSGALEAGAISLGASFPETAVPGSEQLFLNVYPAYLSQVVEGMDSMLQEPYGCFEQTTSSTWPNVLVLDYMGATDQITPEIQMRAEALISTGYQRLLTFEHPGGGFSWFGTNDPAPYLSVTAFGLMEFADMARVAQVDEAMIARTSAWLVSQQAADGSWEGDQSEFFTFHTSKVRNTAFVLWALSSANGAGSSVSSAISYVKQNLNLATDDAYTLGMVANAFALAAPNEPVLDEILARLDEMKQVDGELISWDTGDTQTTFYSYGSDGAVATTALVAHALLLTGSYPSTIPGALEYLAGQKNSLGNFGSTQATVWSLRTLLLASQRGTASAVGTLEVSADGEHFATIALTEAQADVMTTVDLQGLALTGEHQIDLTFVGSGKVSYNLVASHHEPWAEPTEPTGPLALSLSYDKTQLYLNEMAVATVRLENLNASTTNMVLITLGVPPGFTVVTEDLQAYIDAGVLSHYEITGKQLNLYLTELGPSATQELSYRVLATMPVRAADGGAVIYPYYEPDQKTSAPSTTLEVLDLDQ